VGGRFRGSQASSRCCRLAIEISFGGSNEVHCRGTRNDDWYMRSTFQVEQARFRLAGDADPTRVWSDKAAISGRCTGLVESPFSLPEVGTPVLEILFVIFPSLRAT